MMKKNNKTDIRGRLITKENPKSPVSEMYRTIRTNIDFSMVDEELKTLIITSSSPQEGKSTTSSNLAVTFAQTQKRILIVDADLRRPTLHKQFKIDNRAGLTHVITKKTPLEEAIVNSGVDNLWVMPAGPTPPNPAELLGSKSMSELIEILTAQFDMVIFDMPPLLAVADAQILSRNCDGVLLVVGSGKTKKEELLRSKELLDKAHAKIIGAVLHGVDPKEVTGQYYYYGQ